MKTKDEIYKNLCLRAKENGAVSQGVTEFFVALIFSLIVSFFLLHFSIAEGIFAFIHLVIVFYVFIFFVQRGKSIIKVSHKKIIKEMRRLVEKEIKEAEKSNFSCEEQIEKLKQIKKEITC